MLTNSDRQQYSFFSHYTDMHAAYIWYLNRNSLSTSPRNSCDQAPYNNTYKRLFNIQCMSSYLSFEYQTLVLGARIWGRRYISWLSEWNISPNISARILGARPNDSNQESRACFILDDGLASVTSDLGTSIYFLVIGMEYISQFSARTLGARPKDSNRVSRQCFIFDDGHASATADFGTSIYLLVIGKGYLQHFRSHPRRLPKGFESNIACVFYFWWRSRKRNVGLWGVDIFPGYWNGISTIFPLVPSELALQ